jgi:iron complex outermembrane receptor protein
MMFQRTAIAVAVAQIAALYSAAAWAQTADTTAPAAAPGTAVVVVSGQRAALQSAQKLKQNADEVVDSVVAEDIGKLPDRSVTEVLQRIVGVTMDRTMQGDPQHYAVEGSGIAIRGLTYVRSELNGRESFSAGGGRNLSFADVPPELMAGVDVYKNPSAEQIEGGVSGLVNLRTAMPFDYKGLKGAITASSSYSTLEKGKATPSGSVLLSNRWNTPFGEFGALIDLASSRSKTRTDEMFVEPFYAHVNNVVPGQTVYVPRGAEWRTTEYDRNRKGDYVAFQWRPVKDVTAALSYFRSRYNESWSEQALLSQDTDVYDQTVTNGVYSNTGALMAGTVANPTHNGININTDRRVSERKSSTTDLSLNVAWRVNNDWTWTNDFQRVKARTAGLDSDVATGIKLPSENIDLRGDLPVFNFSDADRKFLADPNNYYWAYTMEHLDDRTAESKAWKSDVKYTFDNPVLRDVRFGVRLQNRSGNNRGTNPDYNWVGVTQPWMGELDKTANLSDPRFNGGATLRQFSNFFNGDVSIPGMVFPNDDVARGYPNSYATLHSYYDTLCAESSKNQTCRDKWVPAAFANSPQTVNVQSEKTRAFYTQLRFGFDDWKYPVDGNIGVRYVKTKGTAQGYVTFNPNIASATGPDVVGAELVPIIAKFATPQTFENNFSNVLPSLNLRLKASEQLQFRLAIAKSLSRPDFNQLQGYTTLSEVPSVSTNDDTGVTTVNGVALTGNSLGNPMLKPTTATSVDLTAEWYFAKAGSLTFAAFNKDLKDIIVLQNYTYAVNDDAGKPHNFVVSGNTNGAHGFARGFEIAYQQYYDFVPDWLRGIGTQASLTYVDSKRKLNNPVFQQYCSGGDGSENANLSINGCDTDMRSFGNLPLTGLSRKTINLAIMYERGPVQARVAYNWRSRYLLGVNNYGVRGTDALDLNPYSPTYGTHNGNNNQAYGLPLYGEAYGQVDASFFYQFTDKFRVGIEAQNLNDAISKQTMQQHVGLLGHAWFATGPRYSIVGTYTF